jgi:ribosomal protein S12 methylthiotransferase accessory factor
MQFGKGLTKSQSQASGVFEIVERISATLTPDTPRLHGSYNELREKGHRVVDLLDFAVPTQVNLQTDKYYSASITRLYAPDSPLDWCRVFSLEEDQAVHIPVCLTHSLPPEDESNHVYHNRPNGAAGGFTHEEAILGGLLEVIERDASAIFAAHCLPVPTIRH